MTPKALLDKFKTPELFMKYFESWKEALELEKLTSAKDQELNEELKLQMDL